MILPNEVEERLLSIKQEYVARERLKNFNLVPKYFFMALRGAVKL